MDRCPKCRRMTFHENYRRDSWECVDYDCAHEIPRSRDLKEPITQGGKELRARARSVLRKHMEAK